MPPIWTCHSADLDAALLMMEGVEDLHLRCAPGGNNRGDHPGEDGSDEEGGNAHHGNTQLAQTLGT